MASIYYVHQKSSYKHERKLGYLWSPQRAKDGRMNRGFANMTLIKTGDFILHHVDGRILSISKVAVDCYEHNRPSDYPDGNWSDVGYMIDVDYYDLDEPLNVLDYNEDLKPSSDAETGNAFTRAGRPVQSYICTLEDKQAVFLLKKMIANQTSNDVISVIISALKNLESYDDQIDDYISDDRVCRLWDSVSGKWNSKRKPLQTVEKCDNMTKVNPVRDPKVSINALKHANNKCENNSKHITFKRKNIDIYYMEAHHLIPISKYYDFKYSLDIEENIVCLCPTCHRLLHHATMPEKEALLKILYNNRRQALEQCGLVISFEELKSYYS